MEWIQIIIQGGAVGISVLLIIYMYKKDRMYNKTMNNHLQHSFEADKDLAKAINKFTIAITELKGVIINRK